MAEKKNDHSRMTVYRLIDLPSLKKAIRDKDYKSNIVALL